MTEVFFGLFLKHFYWEDNCFTIWYGLPLYENSHQPCVCVCVRACVHAQPWVYINPLPLEPPFAALEVIRKYHTELPVCTTRLPPTSWFARDCVCQSCASHWSHQLLPQDWSFVTFSLSETLYLLVETAAHLFSPAPHNRKATFCLFKFPYSSDFT